MDSVGDDSDIDLYCKLDNLSGLVGALTSIKWNKQQVRIPIYSLRTWVRFPEPFNSWGGCQELPVPFISSVRTTYEWRGVKTGTKCAEPYESSCHVSVLQVELHNALTVFLLEANLRKYCCLCPHRNNGVQIGSQCTLPAWLTIKQREKMQLLCILYACRTPFVTSRSMAWSLS